MALIQITNTFIANTRARAAEVNRNFSDVVGILAAHHHDPNIYTGASQITNSGIAPNAQILATQFQFPITLSGLISALAIRNNFPAGSIPAAAIPFNLVTKRMDTLEIVNSLTYISREAGGEMTFTDPINGTKKISQLGNTRFGGNASDGTLAITSGTTTLDIASAQIFEKNYDSISITSTGKLAFSNPASGGSTVILRSQGAVVLTSSTTAMIDLSSCGAAAGSGGSGATDTTPGAAGGVGTDITENYDGNNHRGSATATNPTGQFDGGSPVGGTSGAGGAALSGPTLLFLSTSSSKFHRRALLVQPGAGGGGAGAGASVGGGSVSGSGGNGGRGGGALIIECAGTWNFTTTNGISVAGAAGSNGTNATSVGNSQAAGGGGGGGGGAGGMCVVIYNSTSANTGTVNKTGGNGGTGGNGAAGTYTGASSGTAGSGAGGAGAGMVSAGGAGGNGTNTSSSGGTGTTGSGTGGGTGGTGGSGASSGAGQIQAGGGGGGGGGGAGSSVVAQNTYFA